VLSSFLVGADTLLEKSVESCVFWLVQMGMGMEKGVLMMVGKK
jgi:hypothetical protein